MTAMLLGALGARIRTRRQERGWSQRELCARASLSPRYLVQLESGEGNVSVCRLADVAAALDVSLVSLLAGLGPVADAADRTAAACRTAVGPPKVSLLGLRGAGKTAVGRRAAMRVGCDFVELDRRVEQQAGMTLAEIFEYHGPERYRQLSLEALRQLVGEPGVAIVEVGGSLVLDPAVWELLEEQTRSVWLQATPEEHLRRVRAQGDTRPMAGRDDPLRELRAILAAREPIYARAQHRIDTVEVGEDGAVEAVVVATVSA